MSRGTPGRRIGWWCKTNDLWVASVRIRAERVMRALRERGVPAHPFDPADPGRFDCLVLSKRYDDQTVETARRFRAAGGRVVVDLCDHHFVAGSDAPHHLRQTFNLHRLLDLADCVTVSSTGLAEIVRREHPAAPATMVIGDLADDLSLVPLPVWRRPAIALKRYRERSRLDRLAPAALRLVWFGNAQGRRQQSGLVDLAALCPDLERLAARQPLHLTVISNSRRRYAELIGPSRFSHRYIAWDPWTVDDLLRAQHVALLPAAPNEFTACKSDNRVVTAFSAGLAVVAGAVPSYAAFGDALASTDRLLETLETYARDPARRRADAQRGRERAKRSSDAGAIVALWMRACGLPDPVS